MLSSTDNHWVLVDEFASIILRGASESTVSPERGGFFDVDLSIIELFEPFLRCMI